MGKNTQIPSILHTLYTELGLFYDHYYDQSTLRDQPTGMLDLAAFLDEKAQCWIDMGTKPIQKKKTLVINSVFFRFLGNKDQMLINQFFAQLKRFGFIIYIPSATTSSQASSSSDHEESYHLIELTRGALDLITLAPIPSPLALELAARLNLPKDRIKLVNNQFLGVLRKTLRLFNLSITSGKAVKTASPYLPLNFDLVLSDQDALIEILEPDDRFFEFISVHNEYHLIQLKKEFLHRIAHVQTGMTDYKTRITQRLLNQAELIYMEEENIHLKTFPEKKVISINSAQIKAPMLVTQFLFDNVYATELKLWPSCNDNSAVLDLWWNPHVRPFYVSPALIGQYTQLNTLKINQSRIDIEDLDTLLGAAPTITALEIKCNEIVYKDESIELSLPPNALPHLTKLAIKIKLRPSEYLRLLKAAPNISHLVLDSWFDLPEMNPGFVLNNLVTLHYSNYQFSSLIKLLRLTPNLQTLTIIKNNTSPMSEHVSSIPALMNLQQLKLGGYVYPFELARLIVNTPHLRVLDIGLLRGQSLEQLSSEATFNQLRYLTINPITPLRDLILFFQKAPRLQNTNVKSLYIDNEFLYKLQGHPEPLIRLLSSISQVNIRPDYQAKLRNLSFFNHQFKKIKSLEIANTLLTTTALETLLHAFPNIEFIRFNKMKISEKRLTLMSGQLKKLKFINWNGYNSQITPLQLFTIISAAPNLIKVTIQRSPMLKVLKDEFCARFPGVQFKFSHTYDNDDKFLRQLAIPRCSQSLQNIKPDGKVKNEGTTQFTTQTIFINRNTTPPPTETYHLRCYTWSPESQSFVSYQAIGTQQLLPVQGSNYSPAQLTQHYFNDECYLAPSFHLGQIDDLNLEPNQVYLLPALSASDTLVDYACSEPSIRISRDPKTGYHSVQSSTFLYQSTLVFIIKRGNTKAIENSWYWRAEKDQQLIKQLCFIHGALQQNSAYEQLKKLDPRRLLNALSRFCRFTKYEGENFNNQNTSNILNYLLLNQTGACRHRAWLFTALAQQFGLNAFYVNNDCHAFSVVFDSEGAQIIDLGGAPGQINALPFKPLVADEVMAMPETETCAETSQPVQPTAPLQMTSTTLDALFSIWNSCPLSADSPEALAQEMIHHHAHIRHHLLIIPDTNALEVLYHKVLSLRQDNVFFTPHLDAITLHTHSIHEGIVHTSDSPLSQYIKRAQVHPETRFVWFINFSNSKPEHIGYNQLFDDQNRRLNDLFLPDNMRLVMIMDKASARQLPDDLLSRLDAMSYPEHLVWGSALAWKVEEKSVEPGDVLITHEENWKAPLLGQIQFNNQMMSMTAGPLYQLRENQILTLHNPPMQNPDFRFFMIALDAEGRFFNNGAWHTLPAGITLQCAKSAFEARAVLENQTPMKTTRPLNNMNWRYLLAHEFIDTSTHFFQTHPGLLSDEPCRLILTETINDYIAHQVVEQAQARAYPLQIQALPGIELPIPFKPYALSSMPLIPDDNIQIKLGEDLDFILDGLSGHSIPINDTTLFESLFLRVTRTGNQFICEETTLLKLLRDNQPIILHGTFSRTLIRRLQTLFVHPPHLFINGEQIMIQGAVTLVTHDESLFKGISYQRIEYNPALDFQQLPESEQQIRKTLYEELALTPCHAHFRYFQDNAQALQLAAGYQSPIDQDYKAITPELLLNTLDQQPFLFLIGPSGTGKSELFLRGLPDYARHNNLPLQIHHGFETIMDWIHQKSGLAILFDDETNCKNKPLSPFYHLARGEFIIWLDGFCYPLDPMRHRVVCAGNYMQFEGRIEDDLLRRFPHYLEIKPSMRLLDELLKPLLFPFQAQDLMLERLKSYYQKALQSGLIITPRNAMMILITTFSLKQLPMLHHLSDEYLLDYAICQEIKGLYHQTDSGKALLQSLEDDSHTVKHALQSLPLPPLGEDFILTDKHKEITLTLHRLLLIRENKINGIYAQHQGINGFLIEGPPGTGKSNILGRLLKALDIPYIEISLTDRKLAQKQLDDGFHRGLLVLFDEINGLVIELLLNTYLSGTDLNGNPPRRPGFMILAMQNPVWVANRQPLSDALANRFSVIKLSSYTQEERQLIATTKYQLPAELSYELSDSFQRMQNKARKEGLPMPGDRRFFKAAQSLRGQQESINTSLSPIQNETIGVEVIELETNHQEPIIANSFIMNHWPVILGSTLSTALSLSLIGMGLGIGLSITTSIPTFGISLLASPIIIPILAAAGFAIGAALGFTIALASCASSDYWHEQEDDLSLPQLSH